MKTRALLLVLCLAGLATVIWPPEVMSPAQEELIANAPSEGSGAGELLDMSAFEEELIEPEATAPLVEEVVAQAAEVAAPQEVDLVQGSLKGRDQGALALQGELLAHDPGAIEAYLSSNELHPGRERFLGACAHIALEQPEASRALWETVSEEDPISSAERATLGRLLGDGGAVPASAGVRSNALLRGLEMAYMRGELRRVLQERDYVSACGLLSGLLEMELDAEWPTHKEALETWAKQLKDAQGFHRWSARGEWASAEYEVRSGDSLVAIRKRVIEDHPGLNICTGLIARANQLRDENSIRPGDKLRVPLDPVHTRVDLSARFLLYYHGEEVVSAWPVTIGKDGRTIPGEYVVGKNKQRNPAWWYQKSGYEPVAADADPHGRGFITNDHPENPLGSRWIPWDGTRGLGYHGTNDEESIGDEASQGCIRLRNRDVEELYDILPVGSSILVQP